MTEFVRNALGDIVAERIDGHEVSVDVSTWGWLKPANRYVDDEAVDDERRTLAQLGALPGMSVDRSAIPDHERRVPGAKGAGTYDNWPDGAAPPAAVLSRGDLNGTLAYANRLSEAVAIVWNELPKRPDRSPMLIRDYVAGVAHSVTFVPTDGLGDGVDKVYFLDDGHSIKIGTTTRRTSTRVGQLQTGNPRPILVLAEIVGAGENVEVDLHRQLAGLRGSGEWFDREGILDAIDGAGGFEPWLRGLLNDSGLRIEVHEPPVR
jgi:hypothetical protein